MTKYNLLPIRGAISSGSSIVMLSDNLNNFVSGRFELVDQPESFKITVNDDYTIDLETEDYGIYHIRSEPNGNVRLNQIFAGIKYTLYGDIGVYFIPLNKGFYNMWNGESFVQPAPSFTTDDIIQLWKYNNLNKGICYGTGSQGYLDDQDYGCFFTSIPEANNKFFYNYCKKSAVCGSDCYGSCSHDINDNSQCVFNPKTNNYPYVTKINDDSVISYPKDRPKSYNYIALLVFIVVVLLIIIILMGYVIVKNNLIVTW